MKRNNRLASLCQFGVTSLCAWVRVGGKGEAAKRPAWGQKLASFGLRGCPVCICLGPSFYLFSLTDCVAFWRVECLGTSPTTSRPNLALGTSHMVLAVSLASCPSIIASAARLAIKRNFCEALPSPNSVPGLKRWRIRRRKHILGGEPMLTYTPWWWKGCLCLRGDCQGAGL